MTRTTRLISGMCPNVVILRYLATYYDIPAKIENNQLVMNVEGYSPARMEVIERELSAFVLGWNEASNFLEKK